MHGVRWFRCFLLSAGVHGTLRSPYSLANLYRYARLPFHYQLGSGKASAAVHVQVRPFHILSTPCTKPAKYLKRSWSDSRQTRWRMSIPRHYAVDSRLGSANKVRRYSTVHKQAVSM
ncbi:hypothetical protein B0T26DRAFT_698811 [Lasiosphaeria miniovina]|uniref:Secreted protein n=1 Tax=Lasiosphaeria miniovina TaxID=1954250 RepID=A0AA40B6M8_9PEZI|nr:uncharacterized protein B0T26DRAFT_698811 [Lasiosphaeria miniovina]KAK0728652.1 hypothetical protein B0T26DRAFT_698811 [Lasiosphaeria miniovina]